MMLSTPAGSLSGIVRFESPPKVSVSAEAQALTPRELEWLRAAKERTDPREWAQIKQRAKSQSLILPAPPAPRTPAPAPAAGPVASSAPTQQGGSGSAQK